MLKGSGRDFLPTKYVQTAAKLTPRQSDHRAAAFSYWFDPPVDDNNLVGSFYVIVDVDGSRHLSDEITNTVVQDFGKFYYHDQFRASPQRRFEQALSKLNANLEDIIVGDNKVSGKVAILIAVVDDTQLLLSLFGKVSALLLRAGSSIRQLHEKSTRNDRLFSEIIEGKLQKNDRLLFCTQAVVGQMTPKELESLLSENSPSTAVHKLAGHMPKEDGSDRCAAIVANITTVRALSEHALADTPNQTYVGTAVSSTEQMAKKIQPHAQKALSKSASGAKKVGSGIKNKAILPLGRASQKGWTRLWSKYINRNPKVALGILSVVVLAIIGTIYLFSIANRKNDKNLLAFTQAYQSEQQAETSLSQGNKSEAGSSLTQAQTKLQEIPAGAVSKVDQLVHNQSQFNPELQSVSALNAKVTTLLDTIQSVTRVNARTLYAAKDKNSTSLSQLMLFGKTLYSIDSKNHNLLQVNTTSQNSSSISSSPGLSNVQNSSVSNDSSTGYILTKNAQVFLVSPDGSLSEAKNTSGQWSKGSDIASYLGNIYILSPDDNQIYRYTKNLGGYSAKSSYLKSPPANLMQDATSLAINGDVFVGKSDGTILAFELGQQKDFQIKDYPPSSQDIAKIVYSDAFNDLFVLLRDGRILQIQLGGDSPQFVHQYVVSDASNINSFAVDDDAKVIYVSNSSTILSFGFQK